MNKERDKAKKICSQIIDVFFANNVREIEFYINVGEKETDIRVRGDISKSNIDIASLEDDLRGSKAPEYDDYYDELLGIGEVDSISYVSYLIDSVMIYEEDNSLYIDMVRKHI